MSSMNTLVQRYADQVTLDLTAGTATIAGTTIEHVERRDLVTGLGSLLYELLHVGHLVEDGLDVSAGRDAAYESDLAQRLAGHTIRQAVRVHKIGEHHGIVEHMGLRVRVPRGQLTLPPRASDMPVTKAALEVPVLWPALSPGFALARGPEQPTDGGPMLRLYLGATTRADATNVFLRVVEVLRHRTRWQAKVASQSRLYPRSDAVTIYLHLDELGAIRDIIRAARRPASHEAPGSVFTLHLAPGVRCAWEPADPRPGQGSVSFGQHRAAVLAQLLVARAEGSDVPGTTETACESRGIDPHNVWRNLDSPELRLLHQPVQDHPAALAGLTK
ncbi:T3SS effector HopA1 family protein [Yimella sp. cx-51]|uniref:T3SS effector HopA1 family protein n=1 Tax=Yimella sp. cx-51 TaxID=2770551 RepID=UPI00165E8693|nr:T3SS effector HopA1 family protein [Yimella sp. cx-51]MBC9956537.1 hypothetical protein [Yimella sp. cx-51]QTH38359.1 hypothetical protein J5M86_01320 [Yimella sp. cx-51]